MDQDSLKHSAAQAALKLVEPYLKADTVLGIGTGSTVNCFIDGLAKLAHRFDGAVASPAASVCADSASRCTI